MINKRFDVIVVGAALNGLAAALAFGGVGVRRSLTVAIIDRHDPRQKLARYDDARASAITASSKRMFEALGIWDHISRHAQDMREIIVTDGVDHANRPT
ncbi:MAG: FAD-dependent monooxygenase, partial [Aestuariivirga sp.]